MRLICAGILLGCAAMGFSTVTAESASSTFYVVGSHVDVGPLHVFDGVAVCNVPDDDTDIGGGCPLTMPRAPLATVSVHDTDGNPVGFYWNGEPIADSLCTRSGHGFGVAEVDFSETTCKPIVNVFPDAGSLMGTIVVT